MVRKSRLDYMMKICECGDPKRFWSCFKLQSKVSTIPHKVSRLVNDSERIYADSNTKKANIFNEYFASIFTSDSTNASEHAYQSYNAIILENITLSEDEVLPVIIYRDNNKAQGPDGIPARLLKETAKQIAPSLCMLFDKSLRV